MSAERSQFVRKTGGKEIVTSHDGIRTSSAFSRDTKTWLPNESKGAAGFGNLDDGLNRVNKEELRKVGQAAEDAVFDVLLQVEGMDKENTRYSTKQEDAGYASLRDSGLAVDIVGYVDNKPAIAIQVTCSNNRQVVEGKIKELETGKVFLRLTEMKKEDVSIPRVLVTIPFDDAQAFLGKDDIKEHPELQQHIVSQILKGLKFRLSETQYDKEQDHIRKLITMFETVQ